MPVGSVGKWLVLGTLVAALGATGCKEDDGDDDTTDAGSPKVDSGTSGGDKDSGTVADAGPKDSGTAVDSGPADSGAPVMCGTPPMTCTGHTTGLGPVAPGCAKNVADAEVCGISSATILMGAEPKFFEKNAPGVASSACADLIDSNEPTPDGGIVDGGLKGNHMIDTVIMTSGLTINLQYPGCCTKNGFCSTDGMKGQASINGGATWMASDNGYGCLESQYAFRGANAAAGMIRCNPDTGALVSGDGGTADAGSTDAGPTDAGADGGNG